MRGALPAACRALALSALPLMAGCENGMKDMYDQPKYKPLAESTLWPDGRASRPLEPGTIIHSAGTLAGTSSGRAGLADGPPRARSHYTLAALQRGRERYDIYCSPCHGLTGDGNGYVTLRGFPHPPSYQDARLRAAPDPYLFAVITGGYGAMYPYNDRLAADDRWAVVAYIRALQRAQDAQLNDLPAEARARLEATP